jgi:hypothetical protein
MPRNVLATMCWLLVKLLLRSERKRLDGTTESQPGGHAGPKASKVSIKLRGSSTIDLTSVDPVLQQLEHRQLHAHETLIEKAALLCERKDASQVTLYQYQITYCNHWWVP